MNCPIDERVSDGASRWTHLIALLSTVGVMVLAIVPSAAAQSAENVAVVINENSPESQRIGTYYVEKRNIPQGNVVRLRTSTEETIDAATFARTIQAPVAAALAKEGLQDRVLYLVLTKGIPIRVEGTAGLEGTVASVDSELTLLYRRMTGQNVPTRGRVENPYFLGDKEAAEAKPFTHREHDIYLVSRLDAFTVEEALALVDRGLAPVTDGRIVLDQQDKLFNRAGEDWLELAAKRLETAGQADRVLLETTVKGVRDVRPVLGYYSWGSNDPRNRVRAFDMGFVPGALAATFVSSDGRTFREPPAEWIPTGGEDQSKWFAGSPQSLIGDLIREGATGAAGHVAEPYLQSTIRPQVLFPAYVAGFNLVESFYLAMPHLSWQTIVIGDPLCAPFRRQVLSRSEIEAGPDESTALPSLFSKRRIARTMEADRSLSERVAGLLVRGESLAARGNQAGARTAFEEATALAPRMAPAQLQLALWYEESGEYDRAIERYHQVLEVQPQNAVALNNVAYAVAVHRKAPAEALPFATQAIALQPQSPAILDTLAWIEHLMGEEASAARRIALAVKAAPGNADIRLHAAIIFAAAGEPAGARAELAEAVKLNPALEKTDDARRLRERLDKLVSAK